MSEQPIAERDAAAVVVSDALDEWLFRMHGLTSSCDHATEARGVLDALTAAGYRVLPPGEGRDSEASR